MKTITVCMGSSCFARANRDNLAVIEEYIRLHGLEGFVRLEGSLCLGACGEGPNVVIDGTVGHLGRPNDLPALLDEHLGVSP